MTTNYKDRKICPIMSRPVIGDANRIGFGVMQFIGSLFRNGNRYDVCLCEINCYEEKCKLWEEGSKNIPSRCKLERGNYP